MKRKGTLFVLFHIQKKPDGGQKDWSAFRGIQEDKNRVSLSFCLPLKPSYAASKRNLFDYLITFYHFQKAQGLTNPLQSP